MALVDRLETRQVQTITRLLDVVTTDAIARLELLSLSDDTINRAVREVQVRQVLGASNAARVLLSIGRDGPLADTMRADVQAVYEDGLRSATDAVKEAFGTTDNARRAIGLATNFAARLDLELIAAITQSTLTTLEKVGERGMQRLMDAITRVAVRGSGPRAGAREVRAATGVTRVEAERISRTVLMRANNEARMRGYEDAGVAYVRFDGTNDERTCEYCAARHGMVYAIRKSPAVPLHPNCRCVMLPFNPDVTPAERNDAYYVRTREALRKRDVIETRPVGGSRRSPPSSVRDNAPSTATAAAPFERLDGIAPPKPVWTPTGGWQR